MRAIAVALVLLPGCVYSTSHPMTDTGLVDVGPCGMECTGPVGEVWSCCEHIGTWSCVNTFPGSTLYCGGCGIVCATGEACRDGVCVAE